MNFSHFSRQNSRVLSFSARSIAESVTLHILLYNISIILIPVIRRNSQPVRTMENPWWFIRSLIPPWRFSPDRSGGAIGREGAGGAYGIKVELLWGSGIICEGWYKLENRKQGVVHWSAAGQHGTSPDMQQTGDSWIQYVSRPDQGLFGRWWIRVLICFWTGKAI